MLELIGVLSVCVLNISLGLFALGRNPRADQNRIFFLFSLCVVLWALSNYFANYAQDPQLIVLLSRSAFAMALLVTACLLMFSWVFPIGRITPKRQVYLLLPTIPLFLITIGTGLILGELVDPSALRTTDISSGPLYLLLVVYILLLFVTAIINYSLSYRQSSFVDKTRIKVVVFGVAVSFIFVAITSAFIPYLTGNWNVSRLGPFGTVFMVAAIAYSIVKHKLFDIRLVVARSLGYLLSVGILALFYGMFAIGIIELVLPEEVSSNIQTLIFTVVASVLAITFQPLKKIFDQWSNQLFYRDAYDSRELIDDLNSVLVSTIDLDKLLKGSSSVISSALKLEFAFFIIRDRGVESFRVMGTGANVSEVVKISRIDSLYDNIAAKTAVADDIEENKTEDIKWMREAEIAVISCLTDSPETKSQVLGYLLLGNKKSGSPYSKDDIKILEIIADEMVIAIQNALRFEEIQQFAETLQAKVDDATRKLRRTNEKLKALDETKDEFISMASHQLRTPLTSVKGYVSMVLDGDAGKVSKQQQKLLDQAFISSQRMVYLIADLLNVSRLRTGKFVIEAKPTNLADVIEGEVTQLVETAKGRDLTLSYHKPKDFPALNLDETKTRQVIMNFIDNAIYYTPAGGHIVINLEDKGSAIEYTVVDDGIGVPKAEQHHLFSKFYRAGNAKKARPDGTGLGLFMAKKVIVAQGGSVIFRSQEGRGSTFGFSFPKAKLSVAAAIKNAEKPTKQQ